MEEVLAFPFKSIGQYAPDIEIQAGAYERPERRQVVGYDGQPEGVFCMHDQGVPDIGCGDQEEQEG